MSDAQLTASIEKLALYFGCIGVAGHYLHGPRGLHSIYPQRDVPGIPWSAGLMDGGLLKNGKHADVYDGRVFWTCGGRADFWFAFFWWDNSIDRRGASNSGFYVRGFTSNEREAAFDFACKAFPAVVERQRQPLVLQP